MKKIPLYVLIAVVACAVPRDALATSITISVGNTSPVNPSGGGLPFVSGNVIGSSAISANFVAPFSDFCGSTNGGDGGALANCDISWTFNYQNQIPAGETITAA